MKDINEKISYISVINHSKTEEYKQELDLTDRELFQYHAVAEMLLSTVEDVLDDGIDKYVGSHQQSSFADHSPAVGERKVDYCSGYTGKSGMNTDDIDLDIDLSEADDPFSSSMPGFFSWEKRED